MAHPSPLLSVPIEIRLRVGAALAAGMAHKTGLKIRQPNIIGASHPALRAVGHGPVAIYIAS
jgi:hypothetical protein